MPDGPQTPPPASDPDPNPPIMPPALSLLWQPDVGGLSQLPHRHDALRCPTPDPQDPPLPYPGMSALDINSFTPVRMLADCVGTTEVLQYERGVSHGCSVCVLLPRILAG